MQEDIILNNRKQSSERNAELRKQASERLKKNAAYKKANKVKNNKEEI